MIIYFYIAIPQAKKKSYVDLWRLSDSTYIPLPSKKLKRKNKNPPYIYNNLIVGELSKTAGLNIYDIETKENVKIDNFAQGEYLKAIYAYKDKVFVGSYTTHTSTEAIKVLDLNTKEMTNLHVGNLGSGNENREIVANQKFIVISVNFIENEKNNVCLFIYNNADLQRNKSFKLPTRFIFTCLCEHFLIGRISSEKIVILNLLESKKNIWQSRKEYVAPIEDYHNWVGPLDVFIPYFGRSLSKIF